VLCPAAGVVDAHRRPATPLLPPSSRQLCTAAPSNPSMTPFEVETSWPDQQKRARASCETGLAGGRAAVQSDRSSTPRGGAALYLPIPDRPPAGLGALVGCRCHGRIDFYTSVLGAT